MGAIHRLALAIDDQQFQGVNQPVGRENSIVIAGAESWGGRRLCLARETEHRDQFIARRGCVIGLAQPMPWALTGSPQAAREYSLMRPWSRCRRTISPPPGIGGRVPFKNGDRGIKPPGACIREACLPGDPGAGPVRLPRLRSVRGAEACAALTQP